MDLFIPNCSLLESVHTRFGRCIFQSFFRAYVLGPVSYIDQSGIILGKVGSVCRRRDKPGLHPRGGAPSDVVYLLDAILG